MNEQRSFERFVAEQVAGDPGGIPLPDDFYEEMHTYASRTRQRPIWFAIIKEPPMRSNSQLAVGSPTVRVAAILVATLLLAVLVAGAGVAGSRLLAADQMLVVAQDGSGDFTTISEALDGAGDGATIRVRPGTYVEAFVIDKDITVGGDGGDPSAVVVQVPDDAPLIPEDLAPRCLMGCIGTTGEQHGVWLVGTDATLSDLTVIGLPSTSAVVVHGGSPTLQDLVIDIAGDPVMAGGPSAGRGGLVVDHGSSATVRRITHEGWMTLDRGARPLIEDSRLLDTCIAIWGEGTAAQFRGNEVTGCPNGFAFDVTHGASALIADNDISAEGHAIGLSRGMADGTNAVVIGNTIHGTRASTSGVQVEAGATAEVEGNEIFDTASAIVVGDTGSVVRGNEIHDNGLGLWVIATASPTIEDNVIEANTTGLLFGGSGSASLRGNRICGNQTNFLLARSVESPDTEGNEICGDEET